jgi:glutamate N-acetyltransferase/amino-acid N-acetyltransferase
MRGWEFEELRLPLGYRYAATYAGIRKGRKNDLGLIVSEAPAASAALFTTNRVQAAPVRLAKKHLKMSKGLASAILVNAGNANCATRTGDRVALACCRAAARELRVPVHHVLPASTGVIGVDLDGALIVDALPSLCAKLSSVRFDEVVEAIMTTDTVPKKAGAEVALSRGVVRIAAMTKGSGMIHPRMATTLAFVLTDAAASPGQLRAMLVEAVEGSYHRLSVDGDTSTNDVAALLANGASGVGVRPADRDVMQQALNKVLEELAAQIARDGEGATRRITIHVTGARDNESAARIARAIANSPLVKTAVAGRDPNWGRILSAAGASGVAFDPGDADIALQGVPVCRRGLAAAYDEAALKALLEGPECVIHFGLRGRRKGAARFWSCDLTHGYIDINASYRT